MANSGRRIGVLAIGLVAVATVGLLASEASATLTLDVTYNTGGVFANGSQSIAIDPTTVSIDGLELWYNVTGTDGSTTNDKLNKVFFSVITTYSGLVTVDLAAFTFTAPNIAPVSGGVTKDNASNDIDVNGGYDYGSSNNQDASGWQCANWGFYTSGTGTKAKTIFLFSNPGHQQLATLSVTPTGTVENGDILPGYTLGVAWQGGHGVTQVWSFGHTSDSDNIWMEDGHSTPLTFGTPETGSAVTLYQTATADAGSTLSVNPSQTGHFNGAASVGSMNLEVWRARPQGSSGAWTTLGTGLLLDLSYSQLLALLGSNGTYDVELVTTYLAPGVSLPSDNLSSDGTTLNLVVPEPATILFLLGGSAGLAAFRRRKKKEKMT
jgi:hypothetical protein